MRARPPFRADQVGSLLRPAELREARVRAKAGAMSAAHLKDVEDQCIRAAVARQEAIGLQAVTDGEYRRGSGTSTSWSSSTAWAWRPRSA